MRQAPSDRFVEAVRRIKAEVPIESIIGSYYTLVPEGPRYLRAREHDSLVVDRQLGRYHWNSRGEWGDVIDFIRREESLSFVEALARLGGDVPVDRQRAPRRDFPRRTPPARARVQPLGPRREHSTVPDRRALAALEAAVELYHNCLLGDSPALGYLASRGIGLATIRRLRLGYCDGRHLKRYLEERGVPIAFAHQAGLLTRSAGRQPQTDSRPLDGELREFLAGRVVVPELGPDGPVWLIGRTIGVTAGPRYLGLPLAKPLLGYHQVQASPLVLATEGVFDWLTLVEWGLPAVGVAGTDLGELALSQLRELAAERALYLVPQTDAAGQAAAQRLSLLLPRPAPAIGLPSTHKDLGELAAKPDGRELFFGLLPGEVREIVGSGC
jgi:DNA primase